MLYLYLRIFYAIVVVGEAKEPRARDGLTDGLSSHSSYIHTAFVYARSPSAVYAAISAAFAAFAAFAIVRHRPAGYFGLACILSNAHLSFFNAATVCAVYCVILLLLYI